MTAKFFAILTNQGAALLANATALGTKLHITQMAVGDGNGALPTPDATQTKLVNQKRIAPLNMLSVDANNTSQIIAEQVIPENEGGFWIREIGLYDDNGVLIAVANCPETYKPQLQEGSGRTQTIRMVLIVSSTAAVTLKIDPSVVLATRKYVDDKVIEVKAYADEVMKKHLAASDPHPQYATKEAVNARQPLDKTLSELSGKDVSELIDYLGALRSDGASYAGFELGRVTSPYMRHRTSNDIVRLATAAFVQEKLADLIASAPEALNTLGELAAAINNDPQFATNMMEAIGGKQPLDKTLSDLAGKKVAELLAYLGLSDAAHTGDVLLANGNLYEIAARGAPAQRDARNNLALGSSAVLNVGTAAGQVPDMSSQGYSVGVGYGVQYFPNGLMRQWGISPNVGGSGASAAVTFPVPFPNEVLSYRPAPISDVSPAYNMFMISDVSKTGMKVWGVARITASGPSITNIAANTPCYYEVWGH